MISIFQNPRLIAAVLLTVVTFWVYAPVRHHEFLEYDDDEYITNDVRVQQGLSWDNVVWALTTVQTATGNWHPLTTLSHMLDCQLFGLDPAGHHLTNLLFHLANVLLLFGVLHRMTGALWPSAMVAALFGLHPLNVESVAWVAERKNVLSTLFWLLTIWAYLGYVQRPGWMRYLGVAGLCMLGLMSKPMTVTLPCTLLLLDYWPLGRLGKDWKEFQARLPRLVVEKLPLFILVAVISFLTLQAQSLAIRTLETLPLGVRLANAVVAYALYLVKMAWPVRLSVFYPHFAYSPSFWPVFWAALLLMGISLGIGLTQQRFRYLEVGWLWFLGTLVPVSGLVQVGLQSMADRYAYVPLIGVFVMVAWGVSDLTKKHRRLKPRGVAAAGVCVLIILAALTRMQLRPWQDTITLFEHALQVTSNNYVAHDIVGSELYKKQEFEAAIEHYREALRIHPRYSQSHFNWGLAAIGQGHMDEAVEHFSEAVKINPEDYQAHHNLGVALVRQGRFEEAIEYFQKTVEIDPTYPQAHHNWGRALVGQGSFEAAVEHFREALKVTPDYSPIHYDLGVALVRLGSLEEAVEHFQEAVTIDPRYSEAHHNWGVVLIRQGRVEEAIEHLQEAVRIDPHYFRAHYTLGVVLAGQESVDEAIHHFSEAIRIDPAHSEAQENLKRLQSR